MVGVMGDTTGYGDFLRLYPNMFSMRFDSTIRNSLGLSSSGVSPGSPERTSQVYTIPDSPAYCCLFRALDDAICGPVCFSPCTACFASIADG